MPSMTPRGPRPRPVRRALALALAAVLAAGAAGAAELDVVTTTPDLAAIVRAVGGDRVEVESLARGTDDPHYVDPRPSLIVKLNRADALVEGGADLEVGWLPRLAEAARNGDIRPGSPGRILANDGIAMLEVPTALDRSLGDVHPAGNPHFLLAPENAARFAERLGERLAALDPEDAAGHRQRAAAFAADLRRRMVGWTEALAPLRGREVVAYHKTFEYLAEWAGFTIADYVEPKPGIPPNPSHVAELTRRAAGLDPPLLLTSTWSPRSVSKQVSQKIGAPLVVLPASVGADEDTDDYVALLETVVERLATAAAAGGAGAGS